MISPDGIVSAISPGTATITVTSTNGKSASCTVTVKAKIIKATSITLNATDIELFVGQSFGLSATVLPENATDKTVTWKALDPSIATVDIETGVVNAIAVGMAQVKATNPDGVSAICNITVKPRPLTPEQLLRKGNGTTSTFVVMMDLSDAELSELGYRYVFGYNDAGGDANIIAETNVRYCHTTPEIFNNSSNDFWVYAVVTNEEGNPENSNLRHLDGREEVCFDASKYGQNTKGGSSGVETVESDDWFSITPDGLLISLSAPDIIRISLFSMSGNEVYSKICNGGVSVEEQIDLSRFTPGTYLAVVSGTNILKSKKFIIR